VLQGSSRKKEQEQWSTAATENQKQLFSLSNFILIIVATILSKSNGLLWFFLGGNIFSARGLDFETGISWRC
jgi:hypothetical protein